MVKKIFTYIFIYTLFTGCDVGVLSSCDDCYLDVSAPQLQLDENGYYHMTFLQGYVQTFTTLKAETGSIDIQKLKWASDTEILIDGYWTNVVNENSYTDSEGNGYTVLSSWSQMVSDTIKIYGIYVDNCNIEHLDFIDVIID